MACASIAIRTSNSKIEQQLLEQTTVCRITAAVMPFQISMISKSLIHPKEGVIFIRKEHVQYESNRVYYLHNGEPRKVKAKSRGAMWKHQVGTN